MGFDIRRPTENGYHLFTTEPNDDHFWDTGGILQYMTV